MVERLLEKLGVRIGHYTNEKDLTGATCFIFDDWGDIGIDVRGSDTGTINIPAYEPKAREKRVKAVVLTGGSTFGLESSIGVMDYLKVPSVVGAVIYDRRIGNDVRPKLADGFKMAENATYKNFKQGNIGVGTGATTGKWKYGKKIKGGFGLAIKEVQPNAYIGAFVVTNSAGDIVNPKTNKFYSECGGYVENDIAGAYEGEAINTTLAVIITNIEMEKTELMKVSELAHDGMARAIYPVHTSSDGDVIFSVSTCGKNRVKLDMKRDDLVNYVGISASNLLIKAINNSLLEAEAIGGFPTYQRK